MHRPAFILLLSLGAGFSAGPITAQVVSNQSFEVIPETPRATVGDTVTLRFRVRLDERDLLFDTIPRAIGALPPGVRVLSVEKLSRTPDRLFHGHARLAFFRTGRQPVPLFGLPFMRAVKGVERATLSSDSAFVEIVPILPAGNPDLKDIRDLERARPSPWPVIIGSAVALLALLGALYSRRRRRAPGLAPLRTESVIALPPTAYKLAVAAFEKIERQGWPEHGHVARHYQATMNVLRDYLESAEEVPARERTTAEVLWALPPHLVGGGLRDRFQELLDEADLVKFARWRPDRTAAGEYLRRCRDLLEDWHQAQASEEELADAVR
jgi:hypothetical protein